MSYSDRSRATSRYERLCCGVTVHRRPTERGATVGVCDLCPIDCRRLIRPSGIVGPDKSIRRAVHWTSAPFAIQGFGAVRLGFCVGGSSGESAGCGIPATSTRSLTVTGSLMSSSLKNCRRRCFCRSASLFNASAVRDRPDVRPCSSVTTGSPFRMRQ